MFLSTIKPQESLSSELHANTFVKKLWILESLLAHASVGCELTVQSQLLVRCVCGPLCAFFFLL